MAPNLTNPNHNGNASPPKNAPQSDVIEAKPKAIHKKPSFYQVMLLNDDFTPMDFVVKILKDIFHHSHEDAIDLMMQVHKKGSAICGVFTRDVAETKIDKTLYLARQNDHPLQCVMENCG